MKLLSCKETTRLISQGLDRELALGERVALRLHYAYCVGCRRAGRQLAHGLPEEPHLPART